MDINNKEISYTMKTVLDTHATFAGVRYYWIRFTVSSQYIWDETFEGKIEALIRLIWCPFDTGSTVLWSSDGRNRGSEKNVRVEKNQYKVFAI